MKELQELCCSQDLQRLRQEGMPDPSVEDAVMAALCNEPISYMSVFRYLLQRCPESLLSKLVPGSTKYGGSSHIVAEATGYNTGSLAEFAELYEMFDDTSSSVIFRLHVLWDSVNSPKEWRSWVQQEFQHMLIQLGKFQTHQLYLLSYYHNFQHYYYKTLFERCYL